MTVANTTVKQKYNGNGATTSFAIPCAYQAESEILVYLVDETATPPTETLKTNPTHYTISGSNVVFGTAPTASQKVLIIRSTAKTQATDYLTTGSFSADSHEDALDKLTQQVQEIGEQSNRALKYRKSNTGSAPDFPDIAVGDADKIVCINDAGDGFELRSVSDTVSNADYMLGSNNLSDVDSASTARTNLGLGTAAVAATGDFEAAGTVATHSADTTAVHGITNTADLATLSGAQAFTGIKTFDEEFVVKHNAEPSSPAANYVALYFKSDDKLYKKTSAGTETEIGGAALPSLTAGSVVFSDGTTLAQDNSNFFWDNTNNRLGITTAAPDSPLHIIAVGTDYDDCVTLEGTGAGATRKWRILPDSNGFFYFQNPGGGFYHAFDNAGRMAVNSVTPQATLDVNGSVRVRGLNSVGAVVTDADGDLANIAPGTSGNVLTSNGSEWTSAAAPAASVNASDEVTNLALEATVGTNALTVALKTKAGTDPSVSDVVKIGFRSSTATSGVYVQRSITSSLSLVVSSGSTLGHASGVNQYVYVYAIDNAGTVELAVSSKRLSDEMSLVTTTAEGGAGAADSGTVIYSTTARTNVACRLIGRIKSNQSAAGTWATSPSEVSLLHSRPGKVENSHIRVSVGNGFGSTNTKFRRFTTTDASIGSAVTYADSAGNGASFTVNEDGVYYISYSDYGSGGGFDIAITLNDSQGTTNPNGTTSANILAYGGGVSGMGAQCSATVPLRAGDVITAKSAGTNASDYYVRFMIAQVRSFV